MRGGSSVSPASTTGPQRHWRRSPTRQALARPSTTTLSQASGTALNPPPGSLGTCVNGEISSTACGSVAQGAAAVGIDLSPGMIEVARREQPGAEFRVGDLLGLPAADAEFGAVIAFYSVIHLDPGELPAALAEMYRVLRPGGLILLTFHVGTEVRHFDAWLGHDVDVDFRFHQPRDVSAALTSAGFTLQAQLERRAYPAEVDTRRAYLLAARPA